ncbi:DUF6508 domain-containing protein [Deinococcus radiophilus]|uniref:Uncharacterized protein n=1 Tax=Deinococcus radiophilus TaxID=32062 RepID=A0A3S0JI94_9DEIO|nr:DUF6508 domain-containing protein [Deinococcus radiophilus]RTR20110.1 hypothetical protein EJ104_13310 [Deinococcus radiophilus]UFA49991.1 DUF6508 domain-containing protein [Deinococcus radiophilus]
MSLSVTQRIALKNLAQFQPIFSASDFQLYEVKSVVKGNRLITSAAPYYHPEFARFLDLLSRNRLFQAGGEGDSRLLDDETALSQATPEELGSVLAYLSRAEQYSPGSWVSAFHSGALDRILKRAAELSTPTGEPSHG